MGNPEKNRGKRETLEEWMGRRIPKIPEPFLPYLVPGDPRVHEGAEALMDAGSESIHRALASPGRNRVAAFHLLAGDALLTYACEAAAEEEDPGPLLGDLLIRLGDRFR